MKTYLLHAFISVASILAVAGEVRVDEISLRDTKRDKAIECRIYSPTTGEQLPLIVFSHGFGADRTAFAPIAQHWAEHGYVVIAPSHLDGFGKSKGKADPLPPGGLPALMKNAALKIENRVRDITFIFDSITEPDSISPSLQRRIDRSRIGVAGHSLGAYTTMLVGGVTADIGDQKARSFRDDRVRCILPISAQGTGQQGLTDTSWSALTIPMLTITGSLDRGAGGQGPEWKKAPFERSPTGDKYLVFIEGANHVSFGGARPGEITETVKASTMAFWDAYLKAIPIAKASIQDGSILKPWSGTALITSK